MELNGDFGKAEVKMRNVLEIDSLRRQYPGFTLKDISFQLEKGYIMGFIGPNGAGKSTTIKLIMNLIRRDAGKIKIFGLDNLANEVAVKERIGFVYDENHFYDELTTNKMHKIIAPFYRRWDERLYQDFSRKFDLPADKKIKDLSKGMKMKFSLACALSHHAELIIMDEPTSGLDPVFRNEILDILQALMQDENRAILFSSHITTDLDRIADYVTFINQGEIVFSRSKEEVMETYCIVKGGKDLLDRDTRKEFIGLRETDFGFEGLTNDTAKIRRLFGERVLIERPTLEGIMLYTVRGSENV